MFWFISMGCSSSDHLVFQTLTVLFLGLLHFSVVPGGSCSILACAVCRGRRCFPELLVFCWVIFWRDRKVVEATGGWISLCPWVEGREIPGFVAATAAGKLGCLGVS